MNRRQPAVHRTIVVVDVEGFSDRRRTNRNQVAVRAGLYQALQQAFDDAGVSWTDCDREDRGDGVFILAPAEMPKGPFAESVPPKLAGALRKHNATHRVEERIRLRMALHAGEVNYDEHGVTAASINLTFRLLDAPELKAALAESPGVLTMITSGWFFDEVVQHSVVIDPTTYRPVRIAVKETTAMGWISRPDQPYPSDATQLTIPPGDAAAPAQLPAPPRSSTDQAGELSALKELRQAASARRGSLTRNELPADVGKLVGRGHELARLTAPGDTTAMAVDVVDGVAGAGKTALAVRAAHMLRSRYRDGCLFVDLHGHTEGRTPLSAPRALRRLLRVVGVDDNDTADDLDELAASWRTATASLRLLLVLDDAANAEQVRPLLPAGPGSKVVVTSRQRLAGLDADRRISLGALDLDAAEELLGRIVGVPRAGREPDATRELARLCGRMPLALRIAGARLQSRPTWTFEYLAARLADDEYRLGELTAEDRSVEAALRLSHDQLPAEDQRAFRVLGLSPTVEFDPLAVAAMLSCPAREAERALESLVDASLLQQPATGRYRMHDLVAVYARRLAAKEPAEAAAASRVGVLRLYVAAARYASDWGLQGYPTGPKLNAAPFAGWEDAAAWLDTAGGELIDVVSHAAAHGHVDYACWIAEALVDYLVRQGRYHESRMAVEIALPLVSQATDQRMTSSLRTCLGIAYGYQGRFDQARSWFSDALQISRRAADLREEARALGGLGTIAGLSGQGTEAVDHLTKVLELARRLADDWLTGMAICNIGVVHHHLGRPHEALECFAQATALAEKISSPRLIGKTLCYMGVLHLDLGQHAEAALVLRRAAELAEQISDIPVHASSLTRLGTAEQGLGNLNAAVELHHRALAVVTEQTAAELELEIRNRLGASLLAAEDPAAAREQFELVLARTETNGNHAERARARHGLDRCGQPSAN